MSEKNGQQARKITDTEKINALMATIGSLVRLVQEYVSAPVEDEMLKLVEHAEKVKNAA